MIVAIHQPNFFPWLGYFNKIARADVFYLLDSVQFPKKGGAWTNRVQVAVQGKRAWTTAAVDRSYSGVRAIRDMKIQQSHLWREKLLKTIRASYRRAPCYDEVFPFLEPLISNPTDDLADYNETAIQSLCGALGLTQTRLVRSSELSAPGNATELLVNLVREVDGQAYLCGGGAGGYQIDDQFAEAGIKLIYQDFVHPVYPQHGTTDFIKGLSIIDVLMNCGVAKTAELVKGPL